MNVSLPSNCSITGNSNEGKIGLTLAYCLILVVSLAGNSLIAMIVYNTKPMRKTINYFIANMAMSDLLFPVFILPLIPIELYDGFGVFIGHLGQIFCKVQMFLLYLSCWVSVESLMLIAVERFVAVVFPLRAPLFSSKLCPGFILGTWLVSAALSCPVFLGYNPVENPRKMSCEWIWKDTLISYFSHAMTIVVCAFCFVLIIILYSAIVFKLKSQKTPGEQSVNAEERQMKMHRNVVKMVGAILTGFLFCWGPFSVASFVNVFVWDNITGISCDIRPYWSVITFMIFANCALNPCICFTFSGNYRQGLKRLLRCNRTFQG